MVLPVQANEVIQLLLGIGALIFMLANGKRLVRVAHYPLLFAALAVVLTGWTLTVLEGFFWPVLLNALEHAAYLAAAVLLLLWCFQITRRKGER
jgi:hypothetical protein